MSVVTLPFKSLRLISAGPLAEVHEAIGPTGAAILKIAQPEAGSFGDATAPAHLEQGITFVTGGVMLADPDPNAVLAAEVRLLSAIDHPAFPRVLKAGESENAGKRRRWMLLEKVNGQTWRSLLEAGQAPAPAKLLAVAKALVEVAASGALPWHGDLKPENVMIDVAGKVRVLDPTSGMTEQGPDGRPVALLLTESYNPLYATSDVPALGMMLLELLAGSHPLASGAESPPAGRAFSLELETALRGRIATGQGRMARRWACLTLPTGRSPLLAVGLKALGLAGDAARLDLTTPYADVAAFASDLEAALTAK